MLASACLVTSTPEFTEPAQTRPFLLPSSADPDNRGGHIIQIPNTQPTIEFAAQFLSEDAGQPVQVSLLIDYGVRNEFRDQPFQSSSYDAAVAAGTLADGPRRVTATLGGNQVPPGCHTVTLMVTHEFDFGTGCPVQKEDSSYLTWYVYRCDAPDCEDVKTFDTCPVADPAVTCPDVVDVSGGAP